MRSTEFNLHKIARASRLSLILLAIALSFGLKTAKAEQNEEGHRPSSVRLMTALIVGLTEEPDHAALKSEIYPKSAQEFAATRVLMAAPVETLLEGPYFGLLNGWQVEDWRGKTKGAMSGNARLRRERAEMRVLRHTGSRSLHPKYAFSDEDGNFQVTFYTHYGSLLFEMRPHVKERTTHTHGDSADDFLLPVPQTFRLTQKHKGYGAAYFEAQVWGSLWLKDIKDVYLTPETFKAHQSQVLQLAARFGFGLVLIRWQEGINQPQILSRIQESQNEPLPYLAEANEIRRFIEASENLDQKLNAIGRLAADLPNTIRDAILRELPAASASLIEENQLRRTFIRLTLLDKAMPLRVRIEALRQWQESGEGLDYALIEPIREIMESPRTLEIAKESEFDPIAFLSLSPLTRPILRDRSRSELQTRFKSGYAFHSTEVEEIKTRFLEQPFEEGLLILAFSDPDTLYKMDFLKKIAAENSTMQKLTLEKIAEQPLNFAQTEQLRDFIVNHPTTALAAKLMILLGEIRTPAIEQLPPAEEFFRQWFSAQTPLSSALVKAEILYDLSSTFAANRLSNQKTIFAFARAFERFLETVAKTVEHGPELLKHQHEVVERYRELSSRPSRCAAEFL